MQECECAGVWVCKSKSKSMCMSVSVSVSVMAVSVGIGLGCGRRWQGWQWWTLHLPSDQESLRLGRRGSGGSVIEHACGKGSGHWQCVTWIRWAICVSLLCTSCTDTKMYVLMFEHPGTSHVLGSDSALAAMMCWQQQSPGGIDALEVVNGAWQCCRGVAEVVGGWWHHPLKKPGVVRGQCAKICFKLLDNFTTSAHTKPILYIVHYSRYHLSALLIMSLTVYQLWRSQCCIDCTSELWFWSSVLSPNIMVVGPSILTLLIRAKLWLWTNPLTFAPTHTQYSAGNPTNIEYYIYTASLYLQYSAIIFLSAKYIW